MSVLFANGSVQHLDKRQAAKLLNELAGSETGKVVTREPTLEDAYVELVRSA